MRRFCSSVLVLALAASAAHAVVLTQFRHLFPDTWAPSFGGRDG